jgi:hypothetical protein
MTMNRYGVRSALLAAAPAAALALHNVPSSAHYHA